MYYITGIQPAWHFHGDSMLSFNPLLRPIQLPWLTALSVRTLQANGLLFNIQIGQNSTVVLSVSLVILFLIDIYLLNYQYLRVVFVPFCECLHGWWVSSNSNVCSLTSCVHSTGESCMFPDVLMEMYLYTNLFKCCTL